MPLGEKGHVKLKRACRGSTPAHKPAHMAVPQIVTVGVKRGDVVPAVSCNNFELAVTIQVMNRYGSLNFSHLQWEPLAYFTIAVDNINKTDTGSYKSFQFAVAIEISEYGIAVQECSKLGQVSGQVQVNLPQHCTRAKVVGNKPASDVVVELNVGSDLRVRFRVFVVVLVEEVRHSKHNLNGDEQWRN